MTIGSKFNRFIFSSISAIFNKWMNLKFIYKNIFFLVSPSNCNSLPLKSMSFVVVVSTKHSTLMTRIDDMVPGYHYSTFSPQPSRNAQRLNVSWVRTRTKVVKLRAFHLYLEAVHRFNRHFLLKLFYLKTLCH